MALAEGSGMYQPKPPKPQVSYGAPSGPYAQPASAPLGNYGYTPISTLQQAPAQPASSAPLGPVGGFLKGAVTAFDPRSMWQGAKVVATGLRHPIMPGSDEWRKQMMVELAGLKQQASTPEGAGALATLAIPGLGLAKAPSLAGRLGKGASELGDAARVVSYPAGEVTNPGLLSRMGEHADLAEAVLANKDFDRHIAMAGRQNLLRRADDQGYTLGAMLRGEQAPHIQTPFVTEKTLSNTLKRRAGDEGGFASTDALGRFALGAGAGGALAPVIWNLMHRGSPINLNNGFNYQRPDGTAPYGGR